MLNRCMGAINRIFYAAALSASLIGTQAIAEQFSGDEIRDMFFEPKGEIDYPVCTHNGVEVEFREASLVDMLHGRGQAVAFAAHDAEVPYIMVNRDLLASADPAFTAFVLRHECKHHQSGHIDDFSREHYASREDEADCLAIQELRDEGYTLDDLAILERYNLALQQAFYKPQIELQSAENRNARIRACYLQGSEDLRFSAL